MNSNACCQIFDPNLWNEKELNWQEKLFIKDSYISFFHIPVNIRTVITSNMEKIIQQNASTKEHMMLCDEKSNWGSNIFFAVEKEIPGAKIQKISGNFLTKVFEGPYNSTPKWIEEMKTFVKSKDKDIKRMLFWYTTCPKCAKLYGKNYVVILAEV